MAKFRIPKNKQQGKGYTLRNTTKARVKLGVQGSRAILAYKDLTKAAAAGENTKIMRGIRQMASGAETDGAKLKEGLIAMGDRVGVTNEQYQRLASMDEDVLARMYDSNDMTFEVFFNYEGMIKSGDKYIGTDEKRKDIDWFIEQYDTVSGVAQRNAYLDTFANDVI